MKRICFITASHFTIKGFMINHLRKLSKIYEITIITNTDNKDFLKPYNLKNINVIKVDISRNILLKKDIYSLIQLIKIFKKEKYDSIHSITPKAGLLTALAGKIAGIENRIHIFTGQVWVDYPIIKRKMFCNIDKLIVRLNNYILVDSETQKNFLIKEGVLSKNKGIVFGEGSISGVDLKKFKGNKILRKKIRDELKISEEEIVFGFVGRLKKDKGILELLEAFECEELKKSKLLIIGPDEEGLQENFKEEEIIYMGFQSNPEIYLNAMDVFCLPSYREGFGSVLIEAAAMGIPSVASNIYGIQDAVLDKKTGLLHEVKNINSLREKLIKLKQDEKLRLELGKNSKKRVLESFSQDKITEKWLEFYKKIL